MATRKDPRLEGKKLLILQHAAPDGSAKDAYVVALDTVGAGANEMVLCVAGSSARMAAGMKDTPVDSAIVGIVDQIALDEETGR